MPTNARYFPNLVPNQTSDASLTLIFDYLGNISFQSLNLPLRINYPVAQNKNLLIQTSDVTNACIFYTIVKDLENKVDHANLTVDTIKDALVAHLNPAIMNKEEVALEIWLSWQKVFKLTEGKSYPEHKAPLIRNFPEKISHIIFTLMTEQFKRLHIEKNSKGNKQLLNLKDLSQLSLTLECITRNLAGMPLNLKLDQKNLLFRLARQIDGFICELDSKLQNYFLPLQEELQKEIIAQNGLWVKSLIDFFEFELRTDDPSDQTLETSIEFYTALVQAVNDLLYDEFSPASTTQVEDVLNLVRQTMQLDKKFIDSFLKREGKDQSKLLLENTLSEATHFALRRAALRNNIQLQASAILKFKPTYDFNYFNLILNHLTNLVGITKNKEDIFGYILAKMAHITQFPSACKIYEEKPTHPNKLIHSSKNILIDLDLSIENLNSLVTFLNTTYGAETTSLSETELYPKISLNLVTLIEKILPHWYHHLVTTLLTTNRIKEVYSTYRDSLRMPVEYLFRNFQDQCLYLRGKTFNVSMFVEVLLQAFHINEALTHVEILLDENRIDALFDVDLYLEGISSAGAIKLVKQMNALFPKAYATFYPQSSNQSSQHISFDKKLFLDPKFKNFMNVRVKQFIFNEPYLARPSSNSLFNSVNSNRQEELFNDYPNTDPCCTII